MASKADPYPTKCDNLIADKFRPDGFPKLIIFKFLRGSKKHALKNNP